MYLRVKVELLACYRSLYNRKQNTFLRNHCNVTYSNNYVHATIIYERAEHDFSRKVEFIIYGIKIVG